MNKIELPQKPEYVKGDAFEATFEIKGCYPGYGNTLGNALRRVLLSSLYGYAITQVKIKGVDHEFSTVPGLKENIVQLILNLKKVRFKMHKDEPTKVKLKVSGAKEITAKNIDAPSSVEVVNKEAYIGTSTEAKGNVEIEMTVEKGIGYSPTEEREEGEAKELGVIAIDALFTPIRKVNYEVENMRVGKRTDFDKLTFFIQTDGSIRPEEAFKEAANILIKQFAVLGEAEEAKVKEEVQKELEEKSKEMAKEEAEVVTPAELEEAAQPTPKKGKTKALDTASVTVESLGLPTRIQSILEDNGINNLSDLENKSEEDLNNLEGMGEKGIKEIKKAIGSYGLILS